MGILYCIYIKDNTPYAKNFFYKNVEVDDKTFSDEKDRLYEAKKAILKYNPNIEPFIAAIVPIGSILNNPPTDGERI